MKANTLYYYNQGDIDFKSVNMHGVCFLIFIGNRDDIGRQVKIQYIFFLSSVRDENQIFAKCLFQYNVHIYVYVGMMNDLASVFSPEEGNFLLP